MNQKHGMYWYAMITGIATDWVLSFMFIKKIIPTVMGGFQCDCRRD